MAVVKEIVDKIREFFRGLTAPKPQLSVFRRRKLLHEFHTFYDVNKDGSLEWKDFDLARQNICKLNGWKDGTPKYMQIQQVFRDVWRNIQDSCDDNIDGRVSADEWLKMWERYKPPTKKPKKSKPKDNQRSESDGEDLQSDSKSSDNDDKREEEKFQGDEEKEGGDGKTAEGGTDVEDIPDKLPAWLDKYIQYKFNLFDRCADGAIDIEEFEYVLSSFDIPAKEARACFVMFSENDARKVDFPYFKELAADYYLSDEPSDLGNFINGKIEFET